MTRLGVATLLSTACFASANAESIQVHSVDDFLNSLGVCVHIQHGYDEGKMVEPLKYLGVRNARDGADGNYDVSGLIKLHNEAHVMVAFGPGSGASDHFLNNRTHQTNNALTETIIAAKKLAAAHALLAVEGPNEPNNFGGVHYLGEDSGRTNGTWMPVAKFQRDLYSAVKNDPVLAKFPVFGSSEMGAEIDDVGLQFLTIPAEAHCLMPGGTKYADFLNVHNYVCGHIKGLIDNQPYKAAVAYDVPGIDGLFGNHGRTWMKHFPGYTSNQLATLPKVTTETGWWSDNTPAGDETQGKVLLNTFLDQFNEGWKYTFVYEMMDDADGACGFYKADYTTARKSADYLHNLTTILASDGPTRDHGLRPSVTNAPETVHQLLLQKSQAVDLVVWSELAKGTNLTKVILPSVRNSAELYDPTLGTNSISHLAADAQNAVSLTLTDHPLVLELETRIRY